MICILTNHVCMDVVGLTNTDQITGHLILNQMLNPDWCTDVCDITFLQLTHFKPLTAPV